MRFFSLFFFNLVVELSDWIGKWGFIVFETGSHTVANLVAHPGLELVASFLLLALEG